MQQNFTSFVKTSENATVGGATSRRQGKTNGADLSTPIRLKVGTVILKKQCLSKRALMVLIVDLVRKRNTDK